MTSRAYYVKKGVLDGKIFENGKRGPNNKWQDSLKRKGRPVCPNNRGQEKEGKHKTGKPPYLQPGRTCPSVY